MKLNTFFWLKISIFNLLIVALFGTIMRYKIGYAFPFFDQKHLQFAHSHFAFIGWVTHTIFVLMVTVIQKDLPPPKINIYRKLIITNLVCSYGMLISFSWQAYGLFSITFSTLSIFVAYVFSYLFLRDLKRLEDHSYANWFRASLWFNILSSVGTFTLAFMMASHIFNQKIHLASLYYYLHFQYNGFFMFACMGLFLARLKELKPGYNQSPSIFWMFFLSCIPAYFLSVLWMKLPLWLFVLVVLSAFIQVIAWIRFLISVKGGIVSNDSIFKSGRYLFLIIAAALSIKLMLQLGSTIPSLSHLAFGFRPIIIAYLHLILLAIISVFLVAYIYIYRLIVINKATSVALVLFVIGVYLNEVILGLQGVASFSYALVPYANQSLFIVSVLILFSVGLMLFSQRKRLVAA